VVTTVANLRAEKGLEVLLAAAARVVRDRPGTVFQLVGNGTMRERLEAQARELGLGDAVRFLGHREDVPEVLHGSDLFVLPSRSEAFPNGVVEGMAAGLPVVASDVGGIPELIEHERNGLLVPVGDDQALAAALLRLIDDPVKAAALAAAARDTIQRGYSFERMVAAFEALYVSSLSSQLSNSLPIPSHARG
jgi:glycosyltransferase involved in cell wall biosynthesis